MLQRALAPRAQSIAFAAAFIVLCGTANAVDDFKDASGGTKYMFVCAGDQARKAPDFLAVLNFDPNSREYGKLIATTRFPAPNGTGNEPHHIGISSDGRIVACGGLLSILQGQKEIFFFDVSEPRSPKALPPADPPLSSITDEFYAIPEGGFLVTMMGGPNGHSPGRVVEFNKDLEIVNEHPENPPEDGFDPHGISIRPEVNLMVTSDFICPVSTLHATEGGLEIRGSIRVWDYAQRKILRTIKVGDGAGTIDVKLIPKDEQRRGFTAGMVDDQLYLIDTAQGNATPVFNFGTIAKGGWPQLMRITSDASRLFVSMNLAGKIAMFDIDDPMHPKLLDVLDLGSGSGPHYIALTPDESRLVVSDYFLNEDSFGKVHAEGDHKVHVVRVERRHLVLDPRFEADFNTLFSTGPARPHGIAFK